MKKTFVKKLAFLTALLILGSAVFAKQKKNSKSESSVKSAPVWATDEGRLKAFPQSKYISALGIGYSETQAKTKAANGIATFIKAQVISQSQSHYSQNEKDGFVNERRSISEDIEVSSDEELYALDYTAVWQNATTSEYYCVAFIDRAECWKRLEPKLSIISQNVAQKFSLAQERDDELLKVLTLGSIQILRAEFQKLYDFGNIVSSVKCSQYDATASLFITAQNECAKIKPSVAVFIKVMGDNNGIVLRKIAALLESAGCTVSTGSANYVADVKCTVQVEEQRDAYTCRPGIQVDMYKMRGGDTIVSYNKTCKKGTGFDKNGAFNAGYRSIEKELEESFINEIIFGK